MRDAIGGYFGLELRQGTHYHKDALRLNTGRNCLAYVLQARGYKHVWLPYYTCEVLLEPIRRLAVSYSFYAINEQLDPASLPILHEGEAFLYTNYYGLKQKTIEQLAAHYGPQLIVDNAQAFFAPRIAGIDTFYTARKFFGVPDGAYLYIDKTIDTELPQEVSYDRISHLMKRIDANAETGFADYQQHEEELCNQPIKKMSNMTARIMENIDYEAVMQRRKENYQIAQEALQGTNQLALDLGDAVPMVYPYWTKNGKELRERLQKNRIYVATYWGNVLEWNSPALEQSLAMNLLPLPIDQRYTLNELENIKSYIL
jgi:hypothetical protein